MKHIIDLVKQIKIIMVLLIYKNKKLWKERIREELTLRYHKEPCSKSVNWCFKDFARFYYKYGFPMTVNTSFYNDYFGANIFLKSDFSRISSFATGIRKTWRNKLNSKELRKIFDDKREFNKTFSEFLFRPWMIANHDTKKDDLFDFCIKVSNKVFEKDPLGYGGHGVRYFDTSNVSEFEELYSDILNKEVVLEGGVMQDKEMSSFSDCALNTIRIITIIDKNGMGHVADAALRLGVGKSRTDNYSSGGIAALIDVETGIIKTCAHDKNGKEYLLHPTTNKQIVGYKIPDWERYKDFSLKLAETVPDVHFVGWDIARDSNGNFVCIEGNHTAGADLMESPRLHGVYEMYDRIYENGVEQYE